MNYQTQVSVLSSQLQQLICNPSALQKITVFEQRPDLHHKSPVKEGKRLGCAPTAPQQDLSERPQSLFAWFYDNKLLVWIYIYVYLKKAQTNQNVFDEVTSNLDTES